MARVSFKVEGLKELEAALKEMSTATAGNTLKRAIARPAADFADHAAKLAPKDRPVLALEIKVSKPRVITPGTAAYAAAMSKTGDKAIAAAAARAANREAGGTGKAVICSVGPTKRAGHGVLQEFGTVHHGAKPFMRPTWDLMGPTMAESIRDTLAEEIEKTRARAARKAERLAAKLAAGK